MNQMNKKKEIEVSQASPLPMISMSPEFLLDTTVVYVIDIKINLALGVINSTLNSALWLLVLLNVAPANAGHRLMRSGHTGKL